MIVKEYRSGIWFVADTHFSHKNILRFKNKRIEVFNLNTDDENVLEQHDLELIKMWNSVIQKRDTVYILGDFSFASAEKTQKILEKLHGKKHLIIGNHDKACKSLYNYFESVGQIKEVTFKKTVFPFLDENMHCVLSHFPMMAWNRRMHGSVMIHGHTHGALDNINIESEELRLDVGFDSQFNNSGFVSLEQIYRHMKNTVAKGKTFQEHIDYLTDKNNLRY